MAGEDNVRDGDNERGALVLRIIVGFGGMHSTELRESSIKRLENLHIS